MRSPLKNPNIIITQTFQEHIQNNAPFPGIDIKTLDDPTQPCLAVEDGVVVFVGIDGGGAKYVQVRQNDTTSWFYVHLSSFSVTAGANVKAGDEIGRCGITGATAYHLHLGKMVNGKYVDFEDDLIHNADIMTPTQPDVIIYYLELNGDQIPTLYQEANNTDSYNARLDADNNFHAMLPTLLTRERLKFIKLNQTTNVTEILGDSHGTINETPDSLQLEIRQLDEDNKALTDQLSSASKNVSALQLQLNRFKPFILFGFNTGLFTQDPEPKKDKPIQKDIS